MRDIKPTGKNIIKFYKKDAAKEADVVLERALGVYDEVFIIGWNKDNKLEARATLDTDLRDILWLIEMFKNKLLHGDYS